ncbi:hypothetical protein Nepgr_033937 [Nepenthes gracilis]|uniref:Uncharacterized protein n=1 Tax=Nepenthes gracilis TaxID=150966 RepID=A0AAD3TN55_NEPGR|nr:hypothetical protein Nepgr_033937 [Nepenthes gracilis]
MKPPPCLVGPNSSKPSSDQFFDITRAPLSVPVRVGPRQQKAYSMERENWRHGQKPPRALRVGNGVSDFSLDKDRTSTPQFRQSPYCPPAPSAPLLPRFQESPYFENLSISSSIGFSPPLLQQMNSSPYHQFPICR